MTEKLTSPSDGFVPWSGGDCPVPLDSQVTIICRNGATDTDTANVWWWGRDDAGPRDYEIIAYRKGQPMTPTTEAPDLVERVAELPWPERKTAPMTDHTDRLARRMGAEFVPMAADIQAPVDPTMTAAALAAIPSQAGEVRGELVGAQMVIRELRAQLAAKNQEIERLREALEDTERESCEEFLRSDGAMRSKCKSCGAEDFDPSMIEHRVNCGVGRIRAALKGPSHVG